MIDNKTKALFKILLELENNTLETEVTREIAEFSVKTHLTPLLHYLLKKTGNLKETDELLQRGLTKEFNIFVSKYISNVEPELNRLFDIFEQHNIEFIPIKGIYNMTLYPEPFLRPVGDYDILINKNDLLKITEVLYDLGYKIYHQPKERLMDYLTHAQTFMHKKYLNVDIHFRLFQKWRYPIDEDKVFKRTKGDSFKKELSFEDSFIINVGNIIKDRFSGPYIRFWDLHYLLKKELDFDYIDYQIEKGGLNNGYITLKEYFEELTGEKITTKIKGKRLDLPLTLSKEETEVERYGNALKTIGKIRNKITYSGVYFILKVGSRIIG